MTLYDWPRAAAFGRVVPKKKIYENAGANAALKRRFAGELGRIAWSYKLSPETINLERTKRVTEIQVFGVEARVAEPHRDVLRAIDLAIPSSLILELTFRDRVRTCAAYKRPSEAGGSAKVVGDIFMGEWLPVDAPRAPLPVALDMDALYERLLFPLLEEHSARLVRDAGVAESAPRSGRDRPGRVRRDQETENRAAASAAENGVALPAASAARTGEIGDGAQEIDGFESHSPMEDGSAFPKARVGNLEERLEGAGNIRVKAREVERLEARLKRERQFNRRVEINAELRAARRELERLWQG